MVQISANTGRWLGGICIGAAVAETLKGGWGALAMLLVTLLGRWLIGKLMGSVFDEELDDLKKRWAPKDPVKQAIWRHKKHRHDGRFRDCLRPECIYT